MPLLARAFASWVVVWDVELILDKFQPHPGPTYSPIQLEVPGMHWVPNRGQFLNLPKDMLWILFLKKYILTMFTISIQSCAVGS